MKEIIYGNNIK